MPKQKEGFYCTHCFAYHGTTGTDMDECLNCGEHTLQWNDLQHCSSCGESEITAQSDWTCGNQCGHEVCDG